MSEAQLEDYEAVKKRADFAWHIVTGIVVVWLITTVSLTVAFWFDDSYTNVAYLLFCLLVTTNFGWWVKYKSMQSDARINKTWIDYLRGCVRRSNGRSLGPFVTERLEAFRDRTAMWGSLEAVELQALQLLELELRTTDPERIESEPRLVLNTYNGLCDSPLHTTAAEAEFGQRLFDTCQKVREALCA